MSQRLGPAFLGVFNHNSSSRLKQLSRDFREFRHIFLLHAKAHTCATQEDVHGFVKGFGVVNGQIGAVVACNVLTLQSLTSGHNGAHRRQHLTIGDGFLQLSIQINAHVVAVLLKEMGVHKLHVPIYGFVPMLTASFVFQIARIPAFCNVVLVRGHFSGHSIPLVVVFLGPKILVAFNEFVKIETGFFEVFHAILFHETHQILHKLYII